VLEHPDAQLIVGDPEVLAAAVIEGLTQVIDEIRMELPRRMQAEFGDQARQVDEAADGIIGAKQARDGRHTPS
jgi:hypothetical protein